VVEETWEFEADAYAIAIVALLKKGLPDAGFQLGLALFTPIVQTLVLLMVFENLVTAERETGDGNGVNVYVAVICFLLMALQLSNEALEGMWKVCFCMRAFGGVYADLKGPRWLALVLGFLQFTLAVFTVGCSMLVVSEQKTALDAFMNFVALAFLTEIDNLLISSKTLRSALEIDAQITVRQVTKGGQDASTPWTLRLAICCNLLVMMGTCINKQAVEIAANASGETPELTDRLLEALSAFATLLVLDLVMWVGSRLVRTMTCAALVAVSCVLLVAVSMAVLYSTHRRLAPLVVIMVAFWFSMVALTSGNAVAMNPFPYLRCPVSTPLHVWAMLVLAVLMVQSVRRFGVG